MEDNRITNRSVIFKFRDLLVSEVGGRKRCQTMKLRTGREGTENCISFDFSSCRISGTRIDFFSHASAGAGGTWVWGLGQFGILE